MDRSQTSLRWIAGIMAGIAIASIGAVGAFGQDGQAQPPTGRLRPGPGRGGPMGPLGAGPFDRIPGLTDAQREQIRLVAERYQSELRPLMEQNRTARTALEDAIVTTPVDEATIRQQSAAVAATDAELAVIRARMNADIATLLTPEQQKALQEQRSRMRGNGGPPPRMR